MDQYQNAENTTAKPESRSKKFWRVALGSMVGFILAQTIIGIFSLIMMITMIVGVTSGEPTILEENSVLKLTLNAPIQERAIDNPLDELDLGSYSSSTIGLDDILKCIKAAAEDTKIKGISLNLSTVSAGPATLTAIHDALQNFKKSGKFIYAYSENYNQSAYYLATTADKIFLNTHGSLSVKGIAFQIMFYKNMFDKLGIEMQVVRHGKFKSAVEPYILDKMSEANKEQMNTLATTLWGTISSSITNARKISLDSLNYIADNLLIATAKDAFRYHMVDGLIYGNQFDDMIKEKIGIDKDNDVPYVSLSQYKSTIKEKNNSSNNSIAVIYAVGNIIDGKGSNDVIGSTSLCKTIRDAYENEDVKAIVLRINSPGGSALASEIIWHEIELAKAAGKIVVTSMSDYAASGGYYISCNSDMIFAEPNTLTGSIGVFGVIPNAKKLLENKLGLTIDEIKSNKHATGLVAFKPMDEVEYKYMLAQIEDIYGTFTKRVADGRKLSVERVDEIGQGRVWSGKDAVELGLIDKLGSIDDAIAAAAELAKISDYKIENYPTKKAWYVELLEKSSHEESAAEIIRSELGELYYTYETFKQVMSINGIQARMPMEIKIEE